MLTYLYTNGVIMTKALLFKSILVVTLVAGFSACGKKDRYISPKVKAQDPIAKKKIDENNVIIKPQETLSASGDISMPASGDTTIVLSGDVTTVAVSGDVSKPQSADVTTPAPQTTSQIAPKILAPKEVVIDNSVVSDLKKDDLKLSDIKVLDANMLNLINKTDLRVLFENYLTIEERAQNMINKRKYGALCKFEVKAPIAANDILKFESTVKTKDILKNGNSEIKINFKSEKNTLEISCQYQGELTKAYLLDNFNEILDFKNSKNQFPTDIEKPMAYSEILLKTKTLKIINVDKLLKSAVSNPDQQEKFGISAGELVEETKSILDVQFGRSKQACAVIGIKGEIKNNKIYKLLGIKPGIEDKDNNYATMQVYYGADVDQSEFSIECSLRRNGVGPGILFETYKGIIEYGVK